MGSDDASHPVSASDFVLAKHRSKALAGMMAAVRSHKGVRISACECIIIHKPCCSADIMTVSTNHKDNQRLKESQD